MIFKPELARLVVRGKKTQTRRPMKPDATTCAYRVGKDYAVCPGRGKEAIGRLLVTDVRMEFLGDLTLQDALAEGFRTRAAFADYWMRLYSPAWVKAHPDPPADDVVLERWLARYGGEPVWVISFRRDTTEHARLLRTRMGAGGDYTESTFLSVAAAGEAVSEADQARITAAAHERDGRLQADAIVKERRDLEAGISRLEELAPNMQVMARLRTMRKQLEAIDRLLKAA